MEGLKRGPDEWHEADGAHAVPWMVWTFENGLPALRNNVGLLRAFLCTQSVQTVPAGTSELMGAAFRWLAMRLQAGNNEAVRTWLGRVDRRAVGSVLRFPYLDEQAGLEAAQQAGRILWRLLNHRQEDLNSFEKEADGLIAGAARKLSAVVPKDGVARLLIEALARGIPVRRVSPSMAIYRLGQGCRQKSVWRGFTSHTSHIGTVAATQKAVANDVLRAVGLPVPRQRTSQDFASARRAAAEIGYPLVVKPAATDFGMAVSVDVRNESDLFFAFNAARRHGSVLVEELLPGADYRLVVVDGHCVSAIRRDPAQVRGDGVADVAALVARMAASRRADPDLAAYAAASLDDPLVVETLRRQGLTGASVPAPGEIVRLRTNANVSTGGTFEDVLADLHPDNASLAERAAACLGLDHAGIDLITPDIRQPWHQVPCGICEINPTPGMDRLAIQGLLGYLFPDGSEGRIPVVVVVGEGAPAVLAVEQAVDRAREAGLVAGWVANGIARIGARPACREGLPAGELLDTLLADVGVGFVAAQVPPDELVEFGLRLSHCDLAVFMTGPRDQRAVAASWRTPLGRARATLVNPTPGALGDALRALVAPSTPGA